MDNQSSNEKEGNEDKDFLEIFGNEIKDENIFCVKCLSIPKYSVIIQKNKTIQLSHICNGQEIKRNFPFENKSNPYCSSKCYYCGKECFNVCLECKKNICKMCQNKHIPNVNVEPAIPWNIIGTKMTKDKEKYICSDKDIQFFCHEHFLLNQYFCSFCNKSLCTHCKNYHQHINCQSLFDFSPIKDIKIKSWDSSGDDIITNLNELCKILEKSYTQNLNNNRMSLGIIENYSLIQEINAFLENYFKNNKILKKNKTISSALFNAPKNEELYLCNNFYDGQFIKEYSTLIYQTNNGNYEYHHKLKVIEKIYKNKRKKSIYNYNDNSFIISLKGQLYHFKYIFRSLKDNLSKINTQIRINHLNKEISHLKLLVKTMDVDIHLLKQINLNLLYKHNYQLRRKTGNLITELILSNYSEQLEVTENNYILMESIIQIKKKIKEAENLDGPESDLKAYKDKLKEHYESLLKLLNNKLFSELEALEKDNLTLEINDKDTEILIKPNGNYNSNEEIVVNLFFILKQKYGILFNDTIHNHIEMVNMQIIEELKKKDNISVNGKIIIPKVSNGKKTNKDTSKLNDNKNVKCTVHFKIFDDLKHYFSIHENTLLAKNSNILNLITFQDESEIKIDDYKSQLQDMFKNYESGNSVNFIDASQLYFEGDIINILSEKNVFININKLIKEIKSTDLEKIKNDILTDIEMIEPELNGKLKESENYKKFLFNKIKRNKSYISFDDKNKIKKGTLDNPFEILENLESYDFDYINENDVSIIYMFYLVNLYFCAEHTCEYLNILKEKYIDIKMIEFQERNIEKSKLLKAFDSTINYEEPDNFKEVWNKLKQEDILVKNNSVLNETLKKYVMEKTEKDYLKDLNNITKLKDKKIQLWKSDPQYLTVKAYWYSKGIPLEIPAGLKQKSI